MTDHPFIAKIKAAPCCMGDPHFSPGFTTARRAFPGRADGGGERVAIGKPLPVSRRRGAWQRAFRFLFDLYDAMRGKRFAAECDEPLNDIFGDVIEFPKAFVSHANQHGENGCKIFYRRPESSTSVHGERG